MNDAAIASLEAHASRLRGEIKNLSSEKDTLTHEHAEEKQNHRDAIVVLEARKKALETEIANVEQDLFAKNLRNATMKKELDSFQADIDAASKYLGYLNSIAREHVSTVSFLEGKIEKLKQTERMFTAYTARLNEAKIEFLAVSASIISMKGILEMHNIEMDRNKAALEVERKALEDDRLKNLSYYNEVKDMEGELKVRIENVRRQENMQRNRGKVITSIKQNGGE